MYFSFCCESFIVSLGCHVVCVVYVLWLYANSVHCAHSTVYLISILKYQNKHTELHINFLENKKKYFFSSWEKTSSNDFIERHEKTGLV